MLFSNDSLLLYPENKLSAFTNKLNKPINLAGEKYLVGIKDISLVQFNEKVIINIIKNWNTTSHREQFLYGTTSDNIEINEYNVAIYIIDTTIDNLAIDIIKRYYEKVDLIAVRYTYYDNPDVLTLDKPKTKAYISAYQRIYQTIP